MPIAAGLMVAGQNRSSSSRTLGCTSLVTPCANGDRQQDAAAISDRLSRLRGWTPFGRFGSQLPGAAPQGLGIPFHLIDSDSSLDAIWRGYNEAQETPGRVAVLIGREYDE